MRLNSSRPPPRRQPGTSRRRLPPGLPPRPGDGCVTDAQSTRNPRGDGRGALRPSAPRAARVPWKTRGKTLRGVRRSRFWGSHRQPGLRKPVPRHGRPRCSAGAELRGTAEEERRPDPRSASPGSAQSLEPPPTACPGHAGTGRAFPPAEPVFVWWYPPSGPGPRLPPLSHPHRAGLGRGTGVLLAPTDTPWHP